MASGRRRAVSGSTANRRLPAVPSCWNGVTISEVASGRQRAASGRLEATANRRLPAVPFVPQRSNPEAVSGRGERVNRESPAAPFFGQRAVGGERRAGQGASARRNRPVSRQERRLGHGNSDAGRQPAACERRVRGRPPLANRSLFTGAGARGRTAQSSHDETRNAARRAAVGGRPPACSPLAVNARPCVGNQQRTREAVRGLSRLPAARHAPLARQKNTSPGAPTSEVFPLLQLRQSGADVPKYD